MASRVRGPTMSQASRYACSLLELPIVGPLTRLTATRFRSGSFWQATCHQRPAGCKGIPACADTGTPACGRQKECGTKKKNANRHAPAAYRSFWADGAGSPENQGWSLNKVTRRWHFWGGYPKAPRPGGPGPLTAACPGTRGPQARPGRAGAQKS